MMLSEWVKKHKGITAKIGTEYGTGFIFAGNVDSFTLNHIEAYTGFKMHDRQCVECYPSAYQGLILIITGREYGKLDIPVPVRSTETVPIENYYELIGSVAKLAAEEYEKAFTAKMFATSKRAKEYSEYELNEAREFFLSSRFATLMPNVSGEEVLRLIEQKVMKWMDEDE